MDDTAWPTTINPAPTPRKGHNMKYKTLFFGAAGAAILFGAATAAARSYNPMKWVKKPTASQELAAYCVEEMALTLQLQDLRREPPTLQVPRHPHITLTLC